MTNKQTLGAYLKNRRLEKGLSLEKVAKEINISASYLFRLEKGERSNPSANVITRICNCYDISAETALTLVNSETVNISNGSEDLIDILKTTKTVLINGKTYNSDDVIKILSTLTNLQTA